MNACLMERPAAMQETDDLIHTDAAALTREEIGDVSPFLASDRGIAWLAARTDGIHYSKWYDSNRGPYDLNWCSRIAADVLEARRTSDCEGNVHEAIEKHFHGDYDAWHAYHEEHRDEVESAVREIADELELLREEDGTIPELDVDAWMEILDGVVTQRMEENDESSVTDMFGTYDLCEIVVELGDDWIYNAHGFDKLCIDQPLQAALAGLGYGVEDYRRMTGNRSKADRLRRGVRRHPVPLVTENEMRDMFEETYNGFSIVLYAVVSMKDVFAIDPSKPVTLSRYAVASYNSSGGTFFSIDRQTAITLDPKRHVVKAVTGQSPVDICGMSTRHHLARMVNL